ncbi:MAG: class I adenylate-forming enzyme family protein [Acidimicrobiales bacterium]
MPQLIATLVAGPAFVDVLRQVWEAGDTLVPLDARLPKPALEALLKTLRPAILIDSNGVKTKREKGVSTEPGDALVVVTSGTTGTPKGVTLTHDSVRASALATSSRLNVDATRDHWLACLPLAHVGGLSVVTRAVITNTPLTVHNRFDPIAAEEASRKGATLVSLVNTALGRIDAHRFRVVLLGASAPPNNTAANTITTYGMTETGSGVVYNRMPLDGVEVREDNGELLIRGPMTGRCYRINGEEIPLVDKDGWLHTGDAGSVDETTGQVNVIGRMGDVVVTGGEKVWPEPVENVLLRHPKISDVAISGRPDPTWGARVVAFVVALDPAQPPNLEELRDWVKAELPACAAPQELELRNQLPRTSSGKLQRNLLDPKTGLPSVRLGKTITTEDVQQLDDEPDR